MNIRIRFYLSYSVWLMLLLLFSACKKEGEEPDYPAGSNQYINDWLLDSMKVYYYWNHQLPKKSDIGKTPLNFFASLKYSQDRFSRIYNASIPESFYPSLVHHFGFELMLYDPGNGEIKTTVTLVVPQSQAEQNGMQRGQMVNSINGTALNEKNIDALVRSAVTAGRLTLDVVGLGLVNLTSSFISENSVYGYRVFDQLSKPTGYLFYNSFDARYFNRLAEAFRIFKQAGVKELIIDLRYNAGGDVGVCAAMVAMLSDVNEQDHYLEYRGNSLAGIRKETFAKTISKTFSGNPLNFSEIRSLRLPLERIFILTGRHTASAAEFLVKSLRPYTEVIQIGESTLGKDMASFSIRDGNTSKSNAWSLEVMVFKLYNSLGEGDYAKGLVPDIMIHELSESLYPFGDAKDPLIHAALSRISGYSKRSSKTTIGEGMAPRVLYDSRDLADRHVNFIIRP